LGSYLNAFPIYKEIDFYFVAVNVADARLQYTAVAIPNTTSTLNYF